MKLLVTVLSNLFLTLTFFISGYLFGQSPWAPIRLGLNASPSDVTETFVPFWEVWWAIDRDYYAQPLDREQLVEGAIRGLLETLDDPHTAYLSPAEQTSAESQIEQEFQGIGAEVQSDEGNITIIAPFEGSPAAEAGLRPRDIIRTANGTELTGMDVAEAAALVRGPAGTTVELLIERGDDSFTVVVTRGVIDIPSVRGEMLEAEIAYVRLSQFADKTTAELEETLVTLMAENPQGLILDLRFNPGGSLEAVVEVADQFLIDGPILIESFGNGQERVFEATPEGLAQEIPLVVLIDEGSASAAEVLAGAIRDAERGLLLGATTFGKGTVQIWHPLSNGGGVRLTVARWLTPDRHWVHETGLEPDIAVSLPDFDEAFEDTQLQEAIDYLRQN